MKLILIVFVFSSFQVFASTEMRSETYKLGSRGKRNVSFKAPDVKKREPAKVVRKKRRIYRKPKVFKENERKTLVSNRLDNLVLLPDKSSAYNNLGVHIGDQLKIEIEQDMIGYGNSVRAVSAYVKNKELDGYKALGNVSMDAKTKELVVIFNKIINPTGTEVHKLKAELRLKGRHESKFWTYFWASVGANTVGGLADASREQEHTIFGSKKAVTPESIVKGSIADGLQGGANVLAQELKNYPEFTVVLGPVIDTAVISEEPDTI